MIRYMEGTWYQFGNEIVFERPFKRILEWKGIYMESTWYEFRNERVFMRPFKRILE